MILNWKVTAADATLIGQIVDRAEQMSKDWGRSFNPQMAHMDLTACHLNGHPLDLEGLLTAEPGDFSHDVFGIFSHIDRDTGGLLDCFTPRYIRP